MPSDEALPPWEGARRAGLGFHPSLVQWLAISIKVKSKLVLLLWKQTMPSSTELALGKRSDGVDPDMRRLHTDCGQTAALLFSEYICLAIMSFPYSYTILGLVPGLTLTVVQAGFVLYTSLIVWYVRAPVAELKFADCA